MTSQPKPARSPRATNRTRAYTRSDTTSFMSGAAIAMCLVAIALLMAAYAGTVAWIRVAAVVFAILLVACAVGLLRRQEWARVAGGAAAVGLACTLLTLPFLTEPRISIGLLWPVLLVALGGYLLLPSTKAALAEIRAQDARRRESA